VDVHTKSKIPLITTICRHLVRIPEIFERIPLISEHHASSIGGHKGVTKTCNFFAPLLLERNEKRYLKFYT